MKENKSKPATENKEIKRRAMPKMTQSEYINQEFTKIFIDNGYHLILRKGRVNPYGDKDYNMDFLCLQNGESSMPISLSDQIPLIIFNGGGEFHPEITPDKINWIDEGNPIKLREAAEKGILPKKLDIGLMLLRATMLRMQGVDEMEISKDWGDLFLKISELKK